MAQKGGKLKRLLLILILLTLAAVVFVLMGGGDILKKTANWLNGVGNKAESVKQTIEHKATTIEKTLKN